MPQIDDAWPFGIVGELKGRYRPSLDDQHRAIVERSWLGKAAG